MQIQQHNGPVKSSGAAGQSGQFSIAMNGKAFRVLSDTMYQDKIGSIMREISCNCLDSHVMAGTPDKAFTLHLPDAFEPWVSFRDYGIGLSPDAVQTVFCVYFQSTKDQSNDAVGAFGLGAKTPFSYTDQFNVTSIYNGRKYMYSAFINGEGIPEIQLMAETESTEHNGVEIKIGVEPKDFGAFIKAAQTQLRFFPVKPEVVNFRNGAKFEFEEEGEALFETATVKIFKSKAYGRAAMHIIQGPVGYPLDVTQVLPHLSSEDGQFLRTINEIGANLYFNIGEIGVTASREGVEYKGVTLDSLKKRVAEAHKDVVAWIETQVATLPNVYEKARFINDNQTFRSIIAGIKMDLSPAIKHHNGTYSFQLGTCDAFKTEVEREDINGNKVKKTVNGVSITKYTRNGMNGFTGSRNSSDDATLQPTKGERVAIVLRDTSKTPVAKMRHFFKEKNLETMLSLTANFDSIKFDAAFIKSLTDHLGGFAEIHMVSTMADPPRTAYDRTRTDYSRPTAYKANGNGRDDMDSVANWKREYEKLAELTDDNGDDVEKAIYIVVDRQRTESIGYNVKGQFNELCNAGVVDLPLYGIRANDVDKLPETGIEWVKLEDYVKEKRDEIIANPKIKRYTIANSIHELIHSALGYRFSELQGLPPRSKLARLLRINAKAKAVASKSDVNGYMLRIAGYNADQHPALAATRNATKTVFEKTPMMQYVARHGYGAISGKEAEHVVEYINMCHNCA